MDKDNIFEQAKSLIGKKLPGKLNENDVDLSSLKPGFIVSTAYQALDKSAHEQIKAVIGDTKYRVKVLGGMYTQDIRNDRLNFDLSKDFVVTNVYWG